MSRRQKGTGYLVILDDGRKQLTVTVIDPITGRKKKFRATARSETACRQVIEQKQEAWLKSQAHIYDQMTVTELCKAYLLSQVQQGTIKETSRDRNMCTINNQLEEYPLGEMIISTVKSSDIDRHFSRLFSEAKLSASTIEKTKYVLDAAFKWAVSQDDIAKNPLDPMRKSIDRRIEALRSKGAQDMDVRVFSEAQEQAFRKEALMKNRNGTYKYPIGLHCILLLETGMRCGELTALRWSDYNSESGVLAIERGRTRVRKEHSLDTKKGQLEYNFIEGTTKNQRARCIELTAEAKRVLAEIYVLNKRHRNPDDYICLSRNGHPRSVTDVEHGATTIYRSCGFPKDEVSGVHILRRTFATAKRRAGWMVSEIAAYLGDLESTVSRYYIADRQLQVVGGKKVAVVKLPGEEK